MGATLGATRPDSIAAARTSLDNGRQVKPHSRTELNGPGTPLGIYRLEGPPSGCW